jgi:hypothetical protein
MHAFVHFVVLPLGWLAIVALGIWLICQFEQHGGGGLLGPYVQGRKMREHETQQYAEYLRLREHYEPDAPPAPLEETRVRPGIRSRLSSLAGERVTA